MLHERMTKITENEYVPAVGKLRARNRALVRYVEFERVNQTQIREDIRLGLTVNGDPRERKAHKVYLPPPRNHIDSHHQALSVRLIPVPSQRKTTDALPSLPPGTV